MKIQTLLRHGRRNAPAPGTPAWRRYLTASKISAVMRTSPWQTRFQLWHEMAGNIEPSPPHPAVLERGHILESAVAAWVQAHHPEWRVRDCGGRWWQVSGHYAATPDRILVDAETRDVVGLLEIKTSSHSDGWGTPGTDEIPPLPRPSAMAAPLYGPGLRGRGRPHGPPRIRRVPPPPR